MTLFTPTVAPPGRLARIGVALDTRNDQERLRTIAAMCDGAGIDALWVREDLEMLAGESRPDAWRALSLAGSVVRRAVIGVAVAIAIRPAETLASMIGRLGLSHFEIELTTDGVGRAATASALDRYARALRESLGDHTLPMNGVSHASRIPRLSIGARTADEIAVAAQIADDVVLPALGETRLEAAIAQVRDACEQAERDFESLGIALEVPVSIGRTQAEAEARAHGESSFEVLGTPSEVGIFGTLEQCQARVVELAHAGVRDLRCHLPNNPDIQDVIAQLTSIAVGTVEVLTPGAPRSKDPDPPPTWGGRQSQQLGPSEGGRHE